MRALAVLVLASSFALPAVAHADDSRTRAKAIYDAGVLQYNLGEFERALDHFKAAYETRPDPILLFNIAQCHRMLGHTRAALFAYRAYLREVPDAPNRREVERQQAILETELRRAPETPAEPAAPPPASTPPASTTPSTAAAPATAVATPAPTAAANDRPRKPLYKQWWLWTAVGAVVVAGVAVGLGVGLAPAHDAPNPGGTAGSMAVVF
jgi:tetratricopeptide (TPR) repeat protein